MSFYTSVNEEATRIPIADASTGPEVGAFDAIKRAWQYGSLYESQFGVRMDIVYQERENEQRIAKAGGKIPASLFPIEGGGEDITGMRPRDFSQADKMVEAINNNDERAYSATVGDRDIELAKLQKQYPDAGIKTYAQMYSDMQGRYQKMKAGIGREYTLGGDIGWIAGEMASSLRPDVNPISALTTPLGGAGKTALGRIATQGGAQAAAQALEEVTGVRANKRLLREDPTVGESVSNVLIAGLGGAGLQGLGELGYVAFKGASRRWFKSAPNDPAPAPEPLPAPEAPPVYKEPVLQEMPTLTAEANAKLTRAVRETIGNGNANMRVARADFDFMGRELQRWDGPEPWAVPPNTFSRPILPSENVSIRTDFKAKSAGETLDEMVRRLDPETFRVFDKLAQDKKLARDQVETALAARNVDVEKELVPMRARISELEEKLDNANRRKSKIYNEQIKEARGQLAAREAELLGADTNSAAIYRQQVMKADEAMRDMAPAVSRAYARAQGKWELRESQRMQIEDMITKGETSIDRIGPPRPTVVDKAQMELTRVPLHEKIPELSAGRSIRKDGEDAADVVKRVHTEEAKLEEIAADSFTARIPEALKEGGVKLDVDGAEHAINLDEEITIAGDDGLAKKTTIRAMLQEVHEYDEVMKAVSTCSVGPISATA